DLATAVSEVFANRTYQENAQKLSETFQNAGGAVEAANVILTKIREKSYK
ncbi:oleandomycin glycosyltransferase, partial [Paenibacillus dendritiformis C454]